VTLVTTAALVLGTYEFYLRDARLAHAVAGMLATLALVLGVRLHSGQYVAYRPPYWWGIASGLMYLSASNFRIGDYWTDGLPYLIVGTAAVGAALWFSDTTDHTRWGDEAAPMLPVRFRWVPFLFGLVCLLLLTEINAVVFGVPVLLGASTHLQFALFVAGVAGVGVGASGLGWRDLRLPRLNSTLLTILLITLLGAFLRGWQLETAIHRFVDEMNFGQAAWALRPPLSQNPQLLTPFSTIAAFPWLYPYWQAWGIDLFGYTLTALRYISAIFGVLTIPAVYLLARTLFTPRVGVIAALLIATFPPHLHFSRLGINNVADPLFGVLMLAFLTRGLQRHRQIDFALAGVALGLTQYFYEGGRVIFPALALVWVGALVISRGVQINRAVLLRLGLTALVGVLIAAPFYLALLGNNLSLFPRFDTAGLGGSYYELLTTFEREQTLEEQITRPLLMYVRQPDLSEFYGGREPLLLLAVMPFFFLGLAYSLWRLPRQGTLLLLGWVASVALGGMLLAEGGHTARFVVAFPALMIFVAFTLDVLLRWWWVLPVVGGGVLGFVQADYYFNDHIPFYNEQTRQFLDVQDAMFRTRDLPADSVACFVTDDPLDSILITNMRDYLAPQVQVCYLTVETLVQAYRDDYDDRPVVVFFVPPEDDQTQQLITNYFGDAMQGPQTSPYADVPADRQYWRYVITNRPTGN